MTTKQKYEQALAEALKTGGDFAEIYAEDTHRNSLKLVDSRMESAVTGRTHGAGIRVYKELGSVYVYTNDTSLSGLISAAKKAANAVGAGDNVSDIRLIRSLPLNTHVTKCLPMDVAGAYKAGLLKSAQKAASGVSPEIKQVVATMLDWDSDITIANSEGLYISDRRVYTRMYVQAVAANETENQTGGEGPGARMGYELFKTLIDPEAVARTAAQRAVTMLHADVCPAGVMPVAIDGGFGGVIFHEACGHSLEATVVAFGNSEFCGKLGEVVASPKVTAIDDGLIPNGWGSLDIDDEGTPATKLILIENGVLKNYMIDRLGGRRMNMPSTGNARRQSYAFAPTSRMRNTYIAAGEDDEADIISGMGSGLFAKAMGGGSVNPATGEFNFSVSEGYLVKDGKILKPVRGATLIGKGASVLKKIDMVGRNMTMAQGICGSMSGTIPTSVGQPMIRVTDMTVGGR